MRTRILQALRDTVQTPGSEGREMLKSVIQEPIRVRQVYEGATFAGWDRGRGRPNRDNDCHRPYTWQEGQF